MILLIRLRQTPLFSRKIARRGTRLKTFFYPDKTAVFFVDRFSSRKFTAYVFDPGCLHFYIVSVNVIFFIIFS